MPREAANSPQKESARMRRKVSEEPREIIDAGALPFGDLHRGCRNVPDLRALYSESTFHKPHSYQGFGAQRQEIAHTGSSQFCNCAPSNMFCVQTFHPINAGMQHLHKTPL
jgi:hypothetical protein